MISIRKRVLKSYHFSDSNVATGKMTLEWKKVLNYKMELARDMIESRKFNVKANNPYLRQ